MSSDVLAACHGCPRRLEGALAGQADLENAPSARQILDINPAVVQLDGPLGNGKAQPKAITVAIVLLEWFEEIVRRCGTQTAALVLDFYGHFSANHTATYPDRSSRVRVFDGVLYQIRHSREQQILIG